MYLLLESTDELSIANLSEYKLISKNQEKEMLIQSYFHLYLSYLIFSQTYDKICLL